MTLMWAFWDFWCKPPTGDSLHQDERYPFEYRGGRPVYTDVPTQPKSRRSQRSYWRRSGRPRSGLARIHLGRILRRTLVAALLFICALFFFHRLASGNFRYSFHMVSQDFMAASRCPKEGQAIVAFVGRGVWSTSSEFDTPEPSQQSNGWWADTACARMFTSE